MDLKQETYGTRTLAGFFIKKNTCVVGFEQVNVSWVSFELARSCLTDVHFRRNDIEKIFKKPDPNESYCHDVISIWMLKLSDNTICGPHELLFRCSVMP